MTLLLAAGEVSGDRQAAHLVSAIRRRRPEVHLVGTGGEFMRAAGVDLVAQVSHMGSVGVQESARYVLPLRRVLTALDRVIREQRPDAAVLVDNEGFNHLLARSLCRAGVPVIYYFAPQVWLWGRWRARRIAGYATAIVPGFAAEADIYRRAGGRVEWLGHPLLDLVRPEVDPAQALAEVGLNPARQIVALLPGSREHELNRIAGPMFAAARNLRQRHPGLQLALFCAAPHLRPRLENELRAAGLADAVTVVADRPYAVLSRCDLALLAAGTATLEAALLGVPMVVAYRFHPLTQLLKRCFVRTPFVAMPNILLEAAAVPELTQSDVNSDAMTHAALQLLDSPERRDEMKRQLARVAPLLGSAGAIEHTAAVVLRAAEAHRQAGEQR